MIATIAAQRSQRSLRSLRAYGNIHSAIFAIVATLNRNDRRDRNFSISVIVVLRSLRSYGNQAVRMSYLYLRSKQTKHKTSHLWIGRGHCLKRISKKGSLILNERKQLKILLLLHFGQRRVEDAFYQCDRSGQICRFL